MSIEPFSLKDAPALIERVFPSQKVSAESYKEQMANLGKTLTALGSYWKGRKPLVLNKAVILGCLLPASDDMEADLRVFDLLMGMDLAALAKRQRRTVPREALAKMSFREALQNADRAEGNAALYAEIWDEVNTHLGTSAASFPELVDQLSVARFGHRVTVADVFAGSGQIPFEAGRLGADVFAADLSPIACLLTWGAFHVVGAPTQARASFDEERAAFVEMVRSDVEELGFEPTVDGWRPRAYLYCTEALCPETGWWVPMLPSRVVSRDANVIAVLEPDVAGKRYDIRIESGVSDTEVQRAADTGTVVTERRGSDPMLIHLVDGVEYRTKVSAIRAGSVGDAKPLRRWELRDVAPRADDTFQERLYMVQWTKPVSQGRSISEYRTATSHDLELERTVRIHVESHLAAWQEAGLVPDMRIEPGYNTDQPIRERGWTHWHHLFTPRQLLMAALMRRHTTPRMLPFVLNAIQHSSRLSVWHVGGRGNTGVTHVFYNQALNTLFNYGARASEYLLSVITKPVASSPVAEGRNFTLRSQPAAALTNNADIFITDPPFGDAVNYEEILEFFIAWVRKNPPEPFRDWVWDSRRTLAITGGDHEFRKAMIESYATIASKMPDNGIQVMMFTHTSGKIWSDIASIVWGAGLRVTAAWYVATETDSALREGAYVKGTVLLVLRKRTDDVGTFQDELAYELESEVRRQVAELVGLNQRVREGSERDENAFNDADLQMAGYAAALRVLTRYQSIDGQDMVAEAQRPRAKGESTVVDRLIDFAVDLANSALVPQGISDATWRSLAGIERFYIKMLEQESHGVSTLDSYQQFSKAFRVRDSQAVMASTRANQARLKSSVELGRSEMHAGSEFGGTPLRAVLFAMNQLEAEADQAKVLTGLRENVRDYYQQRTLVRALAQYLIQTLADLRPEESQHARLVDLFVMNEGV